LIIRQQVIYSSDPALRAGWERGEQKGCLFRNLRQVVMLQGTLDISEDVLEDME